MFKTKLIKDDKIYSYEDKIVYFKGYRSLFSQWMLNNRFHREDGPAVKYIKKGDDICEDESWYHNGEYHRKDGPARIFEGTKEWWVDGSLHREDGPARVTLNGKEEFFLHGRVAIGNLHSYPNIVFYNPLDIL